MKYIISHADSKVPESLIRFSSDNHQSYASYHGYSHIFDRTDTQYDDRDSRWRKIELVLSLLEDSSTEWILWMDYDAFFVNTKGKTVELAMSDIPGNPSVCFSSSPAGENVPYINSGVFFVRNTEFSRNFFKKVWERGVIKEYMYDEKLYGFSCPGGDQNTLIHTLFVEFKECIGSEIYIADSAMFNARPSIGDTYITTKDYSYIVHFPAGNKEKRIKDFFMCDTISGMSNDVSQNAQEVEIKKKNLAVELREIYKHFNIGYKKHENALFRLVRTFSGREQKKEFPVLNSVSFSVQKGEKIGIIGRNGSGKSTLLRLIGGIYGYDSGSMYVQGTARYISGFSQGLKSKLTMRDNIYLIGSIMGLTTKEVDEEFDSIVEFSGLEEFVDTKIYQFSSGMVTRLSFSIFIFCILRNKPDILLLDEVIGAGGDIDFTKKANAKMVELIGGDSTVLFVSHGLGEIERFCSKAIWLEKGNIVAQGDASVVCNKYKNSVNG